MKTFIIGQMTNYGKFVGYTMGSHYIVENNGVREVIGFFRNIYETP